MLDLRNKILGLAEDTLVLFLTMRLSDLGIESEWRAGLFQFVKKEYAGGHKANYELVYNLLQTYDAQELDFTKLDITALSALLLYYPKDSEIPQLDLDSRKFVINQINDIREIRNKTHGHVPQKLSKDDLTKLHFLQLWAVDRIKDFSLLVMAYKRPSEDWKQIYQQARNIEHMLQGEISLEPIKDKNTAIPSDASMNDILAMAEDGNVNAQILAGKAYSSGYRVKIDYEKAYMWFYKAAKTGSIEAEYYLGRCYVFGEGVDTDREKSLKLIKNAADGGFAPAQDFYARRNFARAGLSTAEADEIFHYASLAAQQDYKPSIMLLASCYIFGTGVKRDPTRGNKMVTDLAETGYYPAISHLAHEAELKGDLAEALMWLLFAEEKGEDIPKPIVRREIQRIEREIQRKEKKNANQDA